MKIEERDAELGRSIRELIDERVAEALADWNGAAHFAAERRAVRGGSVAAEEVTPLAGVDPYSLVPFAEHVLREAGGGPMHCRDMAPLIYALGFQHRWQPKYRDQLVRTLNSLASPSQHPDKFVRVAPRTLKLR